PPVSRCDRRRAAAEVVRLAHGGPEARLLRAGPRHRIAAAVGTAQVDRPRGCGRCRHARRQQRRQHQGAAPGHGSPPKRRLIAVPFWMSTFEPLFWITVVSPAAWANAPPSIRLSPATTWLAVLPSTVPWASTATVTWASPPRNEASVSSATALPNACASGAVVDGGAASADSGASRPAASRRRHALPASMDPTSCR